MRGCARDAHNETHRHRASHERAPCGAPGLPCTARVTATAAAAYDTVHINFTDLCAHKLDELLSTAAVLLESSKL